MVVPSNPVGAGFVQNLARPEGNITGLTADPSPETIIGKQLAVLKEAAVAPVAGGSGPRVKPLPYLLQARPEAKPVLRRALAMRPKRVI
jgi:hypothetical protein